MTDDLELTFDQDDKDILITNLNGYRCSECGVEYYSSKAVEKVQDIIKTLKKTPKVCFTRKLTSSGKRWVIGIPTEIMEALDLKGGEEIKLHLSGKKIVAEIPD